MTEAPAPFEELQDLEPQPVEMDAAQTEAAVSAFRKQLEGQVSVPASVVQDGLLDLWGILPEGDTRAEIERWLTETLGRHLYSVTDVDARLADVLPGGD